MAVLFPRPGIAAASTTTCWSEDSIAVWKVTAGSAAACMLGCARPAAAANRAFRLAALSANPPSQSSPSPLLFKLPREVAPEKRIQAVPNNFCLLHGLA